VTVGEITKRLNMIRIQGRNAEEEKAEKKMEAK